MYKPRLASAFILMFCLAASAPGANPLQDQLASKWQKAQMLYTNSNLDEAEKVCKEILADQHVNATMRGNANGMLGQIYEQRSKVQEGNLSRALVFLEEAAAADSQNPQHHLRLAEFYEKKYNNLRKAVLEYKKVVALGAGKKEVLEKLIKYFEENNQPTNAFAYYDSLIKRVPTDTSIHYRYGMTLKNGGELDRAKQEFNKALLADDKNWEAYVALGQVYEQEKNYDEALSSYKKAEIVSTRARESVERLKSFFSQKGFVEKTIQQANQLMQKRNRQQLVHIENRLDSLQQKYPDNTPIVQTRKEVRKLLFDLLFQTAAKHTQNELKLDEAIACYDSSLFYADDENDKNRAYQAKGGTQEKIGIAGKANEEYNQAENAFKQRKFNEAKKGYITVEKISPIRQVLAAKKQLEADYYMGLVALQDSFRFEEAKAYFEKVGMHPPQLRKDSIFANLARYFVEASKWHQNEEEILFLKSQATAVFDSSLWGKVKIFIDRLLPRLDEQIRHFTVQKGIAERESHIAQKQLLENKLQKLEKDRKNFSEKLAIAKSEIDKPNWKVVAVMCFCVLLGIVLAWGIPKLYKKFFLVPPTKTSIPKQAGRKVGQS